MNNGGVNRAIVRGLCGRRFCLRGRRGGRGGGVCRQVAEYRFEDGGD